MMFRRTLQRYGRTPEPVTPYQRAGQLWDERIGSARVQARNWRLMAFGCLSLSVGLAGGLLWQSAQSRVTPYVVEVDRLGAVKAVGPAITPYRPTDAQIAWFLARFITDVRSLSTDPVLVRRDWLDAYEFATGHAALFLDDYARRKNPFKAIGHRSIAVDVTSVVRASATSFQVKWTEQTYRQGGLAATTHWTAILTIVIKSPRTAAVLRRNPLGLYVKAISWSREFVPGASR
ncbi:conjugal transfer protein TrbF [Acidiphilium iwatense]|uniref:Conjugal transfer protein TrbF n=2 Tax=Acidiphilium iwatense TaxID=768198 RepID=A0ABS9E2K1_9PROT|nr:conjugal transfer protein TrbF [Acidiphilium iwatense]